MMYVKLMVTSIREDETAHTEVFESKKSSFTVGRKRCDLRVNDIHCSRTHALLYEKADGSLWVKDLESSNGIRIRGEKVQEARIGAGHRIMLGNTVLEIVEYRSSHQGKSKSECEEEIKGGWQPLTLL